MSARHDRLLEDGYWKPIKSEPKEPTQTRATKWWADFIRPAFWTKVGGRRQLARRTAYLDGIRGFAAFMVYWGHHQLRAHTATGTEGLFENAFGYDDKRYFVCLPGVRTFFSGGHFAVSVFFVLSGYVLSTKPLNLIQAGEYPSLGDNVASALFRRWMRLHIPVICTTFLYMSSWHAFRMKATPAPKSNYTEELWSWYSEYKNFSFIFTTSEPPWFGYNFHTWSIPVEFKGSIVVYTSLMAFSRCSRNARLWCQAGLIFYFMYIADGWYCAMFVSGMMLCDFDLLAANNNMPRPILSLEPIKDFLFSITFVASIYLGGIPSQNSDLQQLRNSPGWYYLSYLKPQAVFDYKWFYLFLAATFLVASVPHISPLKAFFETRFNQYLGRISFAFYLVHGPVLWTLGDRIYAAVGWVPEAHAAELSAWSNRFPLPKVGPLGLEFSFLAPHIILLPVTLWLAEIVTKFIDEPSVRFAQWAYLKTLAPPQPTKL